MTDLEGVHGPIDFLLLECPTDNLTGEAGSALLDLVDAGIVRIWDLLIVAMDEDGNIQGVDITDLSADGLGGFAAFAGARSGLLGDDDISEAAGAMTRGSMAVLIVYENTWAIPFIAAARDAGAEVVASMRIPAQDVMDALDALEAAD
jgi:hypothetical protein